MKISAELTTITKEMANKELVDALNKNFLELKKTSEDRDQTMLNAIGKLESRTAKLETKVGGIKTLIDTVHGDLIGRINSTNQTANTLNSNLNNIANDVKAILKWIEQQPPKNLLTEDKPEQ